MITAKVTSKGQVTIPVTIQRMANIKPGTRLEFIPRGDEIIIRRIESIESLSGIIAPRGQADVKSVREEAMEERIFERNNA